MIKEIREVLEYDENEVKFMEFCHKAAAEHLKVIESFGRFPHRNEVLGRESTPEEIEYLKDCERWGQ